MKKLTPITVIAAILGTLSIIYYFICGILRTFTYSGLWIWISFGFIMWFGCLWKMLVEPKILATDKKVLYLRLKTVCLSLVSLFLLVFIIFETILIATWIDGCTNSSEDVDAVIVLGAAVDYDHPGDALEKRISVAYEYIKDHPDVPVIVCGGRSAEDIISEADCIKAELIRMGVPADRIVTEDRSTSTYLNFYLSSDLIPEGTNRIAIVTSGFHELRACVTGGSVLKRELGHDVKLIPVSAPYTSFFLPFSMVREFAAFCSDLSDGNI